MTEDIAFDNIYVGQSEADLDAFLLETYSIKAPLEAALEAAAKPKTDHSHDHDHSSHSRGAEPDYKTAPVEWVKFKAQQFIDEAIKDPKKAFVDRPVTGGVAGVVFATVVGLLGVRASHSPFLSSFFDWPPPPVNTVISLLLPSSQTVASAQKSAASAASAAKKKTDTITADVAEKVEEVKEAVVEKAQKVAAAEDVKEVAEGVRTRTTRSSAKKQEE
jgi:calnexin